MEHGATDHEVGEGVWKIHFFNRLDPKVLHRKSWRKGCSEAARVLNRRRICIHPEHVVLFPEKIDQVAAETAARIEDPHPRPDAASE